MRTSMIVLWVLALAAIVLLGGCHGETHHEVTTETYGTLEGLVITPEPQTLEISTGTEFELDWEYGTYPPKTFSVELDRVSADGSKQGILTDLHKLGNGHYRLEPIVSLPEETFLLLRVTSSYQEERAIYLTDSVFNATKTPGGEPGRGKIEHIVTTDE
jgi:hypothetical protein